MRSDREKRAIWLTIPSFVGIVTAAVWRLLPLSQHPGVYDVFVTILLLLVDLCCFVGFWSSLGFFDFLIKAHREIRKSVIVMGSVINAIWIVYVIVFCFIFMPSFNMQGGSAKAKVPNSSLIK
jgi:hypothetical protein